MVAPKGDGASLPAGGSGSDDQGLKRMARGGGLNIVGAAVNQSTLFAITALLAVTLGKEAVGRYAASYAVLAILGLLSLVGFRSALTRFVAVYLVEQDPARVRGTVRLGLGLSLISSAALGAGLALLATPVADLMNDPALAECLRLVGLALPAATVSDAALSGTQGWRTQRPFTYIGRIFEPALRLLLTGGAVWAGYGVVGALWALVVAAWIAAALAVWALQRRLRTVPRQHPIMPAREIFSFSMLSWVSALASTGLIWADMLILTALKDAGEVGIYSVATRIVGLAVFVMAPIQAAFAPQIAHLHHLGNMAELQRSYRSATTWIVRLALPAFVMLLTLPSQMLHLFGPQFAAGAIVTVILGFGQLVNAATGPCGTVLNMSGRVGVNMADNVAVLALNVGLNFALIPVLGITGAAIAWSLSLIVVNVVRVWQVRRFMGVSPYDPGILRALGAAAIVAAAVAAAVQLTATWWLDLVVGAVVVVTCYPLLVWRFGVSRDDLHVISAVFTRRRRTPKPPAGAAGRPQLGSASPDGGAGDR